MHQRGLRAMQPERFGPPTRDGQAEIFANIESYYTSKKTILPGYLAPALLEEIHHNLK